MCGSSKTENKSDSSVKTTSKDQKVTAGAENATAVGLYDTSSIHLYNEFPEEVANFAGELLEKTTDIVKGTVKAGYEANAKSLETVSKRFDKQESDIENLASLTTPMTIGATVLGSVLIFSMVKKGN